MIIKNCGKCKETNKKGVNMIIIKGMEMPANCMLCPFIDESGQYCQVDGKELVPNILCIDIEGVRENFKVLKSGRHTDCPLIEIRERIKK